MMRNNQLLLKGLVLSVLCLSGCASGGSNQSGALRPAYKGLPFIQPRTTVIPKASGPIIRPQPGPALPDAGGMKWPGHSPNAAAARRRPRPVDLPTITPRPGPGAPIATNPAPAALSGGIEIVPGPSIRARRSQMEMLPAPRSDESASDIPVPQTPVGTRREGPAPPK